MLPMRVYSHWATVAKVNGDFGLQDCVDLRIYFDLRSQTQSEIDHPIYTACSLGIFTLV